MSKKRSPSGRRHSKARAKRLTIARKTTAGTSPAGPADVFSATPENIAAAVKALLADSFAAHTRALTLRTQKDFFHGDEQLTIARDKRLEAHGLDPKHTAPAWTTDADHWRVYPADEVHKELLAFYERRLNPPKETE